MTPARIRIAHDALCRTESAFLKHYKRGGFAAHAGAFYTGSELPGPGFNFAACVGPAGTLEEVVAFGRTFFAGATDGWGVLVEGRAGHPIEAEILAAGWAVAEDEPAFVIEELPAGVNPAARVPMTFRRVATQTETDTFQRICTQAFNSPPDFAALIMPSLAFATDPRMCWVVGEVDGEPVCCGGYYRAGPTAAVGPVATLEPHRGRGLGAALLDHLLADAAASGCAHACLRSGPKSVPLYERAGFRYACQHRTYAVPS